VVAKCGGAGLAEVRIGQFMPTRQETCQARTFAEGAWFSELCVCLGQPAENLALFRNIALGLLKEEKTRKRGIAGKRKICSWDNGYLLHVLSGEILRRSMPLPCRSPLSPRSLDPSIPRFIEERRGQHRKGIVAEGGGGQPHRRHACAGCEHGRQQGNAKRTCPRRSLMLLSLGMRVPSVRMGLMRRRAFGWPLVASCVLSSAACREIVGIDDRSATHEDARGAGAAGTPGGSGNSGAGGAGQGGGKSGEAGAAGSGEKGGAGTAGAGAGGAPGRGRRVRAIRGQRPARPAWQTRAAPSWMPVQKSRHAVRPCSACPSAPTRAASVNACRPLCLRSSTSFTAGRLGARRSVSSPAEERWRSSRPG
jgi:hypothetical protein